MSLNNRTAICTLLPILALLLGALPAGALNHTVRPSDTLFGLSLKYDVPQNWIIRANNLDGEVIRSGQELIIPVDGIKTVTVRPGDTVSALSVEFGVSQDEIISSNGLDGADLRIGQVLLMPEALPGGRYRILPGDTLTGIAVNHETTVEKLRMYNEIENDLIKPGQVIQVAPDRPEGHRVGDGESLWSIASRYKLAMDDLRRWNSIDDGAYIHPGEVLVLYPGINGAPEITSEIALASIRSERPADNDSGRDSPPRFGEYYFSAPNRDGQPDNRYWEEPDASTMTDYRRAIEVLDIFDDEIASMSRLSDRLAGWHIVIDPGHGGLDPGAIVTVEDGDGNPLTVTEDEYAYDVSMRIYRALLRHGASASFTILSPDHHVRDGEDARQTFVHRKNEVYDDETHNGNAGWRPVGTTDGLDLRKTIASRQISGAAHLAKRKGTLFLSIHADNSSDLPAGRAVLFDGETTSEKNSSRNLAAVLASNLGAGSFIKEQPLRVLRGNPADAAVLIEARNIHYERNCWALRSAELREQDALMIVGGILDWAAR